MYDLRVAKLARFLLLLSSVTVLLQFSFSNPNNDDQEYGYNQFKQGNFVEYLGIGYANEGFYTFWNDKNVYKLKTPLVVPPIQLAFEYAVMDFYSLGAEFIFYRFKSTEPLIEGSVFNLFDIRFRSVAFYSFDRFTPYLGAGFGFYHLQGDTLKIGEQTFSAPIEIDSLGVSQFSINIFAGFKVFFIDTIFLYAETGYPFPLFTAGIGFKH